MIFEKKKRNDRQFSLENSQVKTQKVFEKKKKCAPRG